MFAILWAILALLAAAVSIVLTADATTRAGALRPVARAIDAEPQRLGLRDGDLAERLAGHPVPAAVTVTAGFRHGTALLIAAVVGLLLTLGALVTGSGFTALIATASLGLSAYIGLRYGNARRLHADRDRIRLRRWRTNADIPMSAVRGLGFVPARDGRTWIALWCDASASSGLPEPLTESAAVDGGICWLRLDPIESVSTVQLLRLWQFFADRWTIGDADGKVHPAPADLAQLFTTATRFGFDAATGGYRAEGVPVAHVLHRLPSRPQLLRAKLMRAVDKLPHDFEVRDGLLRTRWLISKPDAAWKTAFYVTDRHGRRVGTLRAVSAASRNFDLCGTDNQVLATLRPGEPRTTVVDTGGKAIAVWDTRSGDLFSDAEASLRPLCLLSPIIARFAGTATVPGAGNSGAETVSLAPRPTAPSEDTTVPLRTESTGDETVPLPAEPAIESKGEQP